MFKSKAEEDATTPFKSPQVLNKWKEGPGQFAKGTPPFKIGPKKGPLKAMFAKRS